MKKLVSLVLTVLLVASVLCSCSGNEETDTAPEAATTQEETSLQEEETAAQDEETETTAEETTAKPVIPHEKMEIYLGKTVNEIKEIFGTDCNDEGYMEATWRCLVYDKGVTPLRFWFEVPEYYETEKITGEEEILEVSFAPDGSDDYIVTGSLSASLTCDQLESTGLGVFEFHPFYRYRIDDINGFRVTYEYEEDEEAPAGDALAVGVYVGKK